MRKLKGIIRKYMPSKMLKGLILLYRQLRCMANLSKRMGGGGGSALYCNCCNKYFSKFVGYNYGKDYPFPERYENTPNDVLCPCCYSLPRHRIVCDYLEKSNTLLPSMKILVFAPVRAYELWFKRNHLKYISTDLFDRTVDVIADIRNTPWDDNEFDFISCDHVLEVVPDYILALKELFRIVKPGGIVAITSAMFFNKTDTFEDYSTSYGHCTIFGTDFQNILRDVGFNISIYDGDDCEERILPVVGPASHDSNKVLLCKK